MRNLNPIMTELISLKVPFKAFRNDEVIWCPTIRSEATTNKIMYADYDEENDTIALGIKNTNNNKIIDRKVVLSYHDALSIMLNFYYTEVE